MKIVNELDKEEKINANKLADDLEKGFVWNKTGDTNYWAIVYTKLKELSGVYEK